MTTFNIVEAILDNDEAVCPTCHTRYATHTEGSGEVRTRGEWASTGLKWIRCPDPFHAETDHKAGKNQ
ncbi:MAG TPA: hypothetical protein VI172_04045 [Candidatus Dormibacteraeota bacterium]